MWGLGALFYFYEYLLQVSPGVMINGLMRDFNVNATILGYLGASFTFAYASMQLPVGMLLDKFGPSRLLTISSLLCAVGCLLFGMSSTLFIAMLGRFLIGLGAATAVVGCMKLTTNWFAFERFGLLTGLLLMFGMLGAIGGEAPVALMVKKLDWRNTTLILGLAGVVLAIVIGLFMRDTPHHSTHSFDTDETSTKDGASPSAELSVWQGLFVVLKNKQTWLVAIYGGLMFAPTTTLGGLWGVPFLKQLYGIESPAAAGMISLLFLGWAIGAPISSWFASYINRRLPSMFMGTIGLLIVTLCIIYLPVSKTFMSILLFCFGFFTSGFLPAFTIIREISPHETSATALGFMNMMNMIGGTALQPLIGILLDFTWNGSTLNGVRAYEMANFHIALSVLPCFMLAALLILPFIRETYGKSIYINTNKKSNT